MEGASDNKLLGALQAAKVVQYQLDLYITTWSPDCNNYVLLLKLSGLVYQSIPEYKK